MRAVDPKIKLMAVSYFWKDDTELETLLKGAAHSPDFTPDPLLRAHGDIDIWCMPEAVSLAWKALAEMGYRSVAESKGRHLPPLACPTVVAAGTVQQVAVDTQPPATAPNAIGDPDRAPAPSNAARTAASQHRRRRSDRCPTSAGRPSARSTPPVSVMSDRPITCAPLRPETSPLWRPFNSARMTRPRVRMGERPGRGSDDG
jgi:hypothetical protein